MSFTIITDTSCNLPDSYIDAHDLKIISLVFMADGNTYRSYTKHEPLDLKQFYTMMREKKTITTSSVSPQDCIEVFEAELKAGRDILYIGFSSGLSATYQTASSILMQLAECYPDQKIYHIDSLAAALGQGLLVHHAVKLRGEGKSIAEVYRWLEENRLRLCHWFTVDDLFFLHRGGRVSKTAAIVGSMVGIKPVLHVDTDGKLVMAGKVRGRKTALDALIEKLAAIPENERSQPVYIVHGDCEDEAKYVAAQIAEKYGMTDILMHCLEPVIGCHAGPGTIAVFYLGDNR